MSVEKELIKLYTEFEKEHYGSISNPAPITFSMFMNWLRIKEQS